MMSYNRGSVELDEGPSSPIKVDEKFLAEIEAFKRLRENSRKSKKHSKKVKK
jgi:hypothetical protein